MTVDITTAIPGETITTHHAENVLTDGLPWTVQHKVRMSAIAVVAMIRALRAENGLSSSVSNRAFYAVDDLDDETATVRTIAYTYDDAGFLAVVTISTGS